MNVTVGRVPAVPLGQGHTRGRLPQRSKAGTGIHSLREPRQDRFTHLIRMGPVKRKGGIKARRLIAATSDNYRAELFGLA